MLSQRLGITNLQAQQKLQISSVVSLGNNSLPETLILYPAPIQTYASNRAAVWRLQRTRNSPSVIVETSLNLSSEKQSKSISDLDNKTLNLAQQEGSQVSLLILTVNWHDSGDIYFESSYEFNTLRALFWTTLNEIAIERHTYPGRSGYLDTLISSLARNHSEVIIISRKLISSV